MSRTTKTQLKAELSISDFRPAMKTVFSHHETRQDRFSEWLAPIYKEVEVGHLVAHAHGYTARIHECGRVTLDAGWSYHGSCFDGNVKGKSFLDIQKKAVALLHKSIDKSGLRN